MKKSPFLPFFCLLLLSVSLYAQEEKKPEEKKEAKSLSEVERLIAEGDELVKQNDYEKAQEALEKFREALRKEPGNVAAIRGVGTALIATGMLDEAMDLLEPAVKEHKENAKLLLTLSRTYYWKAKRCIEENADGFEIESYFNDAARRAEEAATGDPKSWEALVLLGDIYYNKSDFPKAAEALEKALKVNPKDEYAAYLLGEVYWQAGKTEESARAFISLARNFEAYKATGQYRAGLCFSQADKVKEASEAFQKAIQADVNFEDAYSALWTLYAKKGQYKEALEAYKSLVKINANNARAYFYLGYVFQILKMDNEALENYTQAIEKSPEKKHPGAHYYRGEILYKQGKENEAVEELFTALKQNEKYDAPYNKLWEIAGGYFQKTNYKAAEGIYLRLIGFRPDDGFLRSNYGLVLRDWGKYKEALEQYLKAVELLPEDPQIQNDCGVIYQYHMNQPENAIPYYKRAEELGNNIDALGNLGQIYFESGQYEKALIRFKKILLQQPNHAIGTQGYNRCVRILKKKGVDIKEIEKELEGEG